MLPFSSVCQKYPNREETEDAKMRRQGWTTWAKSSAGTDWVNPSLPFTEKANQRRGRPAKLSELAAHLLGGAGEQRKWQRPHVLLPPNVMASVFSTPRISASSMIAAALPCQYSSDPSALPSSSRQRHVSGSCFGARRSQQSIHVPVSGSTLNMFQLANRQPKDNRQSCECFHRG